MIKRIIKVLGVLVLLYFCIYIYYRKDYETFKALVTSINDNSIIVEPLENEIIKRSYQKIEVVTDNKKIVIGDTVKISYEGELIETFPPKLDGKIVKVISDSKLSNRIIQTYLPFNDNKLETTDIIYNKKNLDTYISNHYDLNLMENLKPYTDNYFEKNMLIIGTIGSNDDSLKYDIKDYNINKNEITVNVNKISSTIVSNKKVMWHLIIEISLKEGSKITSAKLNIINENN